MPGARHLLVATVLVISACASPAATTTTTDVAGPAEPEPGETTTTSSTLPIVSVDATFAISRLVFGEEGRIELINTGPQTGNISGHWVAIHPFYLELPSLIVEVGHAVVIGLDADTLQDGWVDGVGFLPALAAVGGEVALYTTGTFGDPDAIVDYVEWGSSGHRRSAIAIAAGIWDATFVLPMAGSETGLTRATATEAGFEAYTEEPG